MHFGIIDSQQRLLTLRPFPVGELRSYDIPHLSYAEPVLVAGQFLDAPSLILPDRFAAETLAEDGLVLMGGDRRDHIVLDEDLDRSELAVVSLFKGARKLYSTKVISFE